MLRADRFDEARLVAYARDELQKTGDDLMATKRGRLMLWSSKRDPALAGFFIDEHTFALGAGGWAARMADLVNQTNPSDSAATNLELVRLVERAAGTHAIWGAAIVPAETRRSLAAQPGLTEAATINTMSAAIDFGKGMEAVLIADVATPDAARSLATKVAQSLRDAKRNPQVLMLGLGPYLGGVSARAVDRTFEVRATLGPGGGRRSGHPPGRDGRARARRLRPRLRPAARAVAPFGADRTARVALRRMILPPKRPQDAARGASQCDLEPTCSVVSVRSDSRSADR